MSKQSKISLGMYLREHREAKGISIDEAAIETNIARKYIEALEKDEYGFFPAELYLTGFLSAYVEILEVDKDLVFSMYQRAIGKEQEIPLEELYALHKSDDNLKKISVIVMIGLPVILLIIFVFILFGQNNSSKKSNKGTFEARARSSNKELTLDLENVSPNNELEVGFYDKVLLMRKDNIENVIEFLGQGKAKNQIVFQLGQNRYTYKNGDVLNADLNNDGINDIGLEIICVNDQNAKIAITAYNNGNNTSQSFMNQTMSLFNISRFTKSIRNELPITILSNSSSMINIQVTAARPVWVGFQADNQTEQYMFLNIGEIARVSFKDGLALLLGNAGAATITFTEFTNSIRGGTAGESSYSIFYKKMDGSELKLFRAQLK